jgi:hypothetical protein
MADYTVDEVITQCEDFLENSEDNYLILLFNEKLMLSLVFRRRKRNLPTKKPGTCTQ